MGAFENRVIILLAVISWTKAHLWDGSSDEDLIIQLANPVGKIRGHILQSDNGSNYYAFQEIPYAKPPVGELRLKAPREADSWEGILNTTQNTKICLQSVPSIKLQNEDCLYLNVYTPVKPGSDKNLSVFVWIHGGAFILWDGTINRHGPKYLMDYNIVVVTMNYRLGALGFLATEDGVIPGNLGLRDQNLALKWVRDNIHLFGGDPQKVTIGGQSMGASSVSAHILSQQSRGLFRSAIQQSGSAMFTLNYQRRPDVYAFQLGSFLDSSLEFGNSTRLLDILQNATAAQIIEAQNKVVNVAPVISIIADVVWSATLETAVKEEEAFLSKPFRESFLNGDSDDWSMVPQLITMTSNEIIFFTEDAHQPNVLVVDRQKVQANTARLDEDPINLINDKYNIPDKYRKEVGTELKKLYTNATFLEDKASYLKFADDIFFSLATINQADLASKHVPVYLGQFSYSPYGNDSATRGAEHTEELQYLWDNVEDPGFVDEFQTVIRHQMLKLWTNFIKYQNPTPDEDETLNKIRWPTVQSGNLSYMNINDTLTISSNPKLYIQKQTILDKYKKSPLIL